MRVALAGTYVLITGASAGIGRDIARQLAKRVAGIALVARRRERLEALREELLVLNPSLRVLVCPTDLVELSAIDQMIHEVEATFPSVDILINNAGFGDFAYFVRADWQKLHRMLQLNITALTFLAHRLMPAMVARKKGAIMNISSGFGLQFMPGFSTYVGTKHYVTGFTESLRIEARKYGVSVTQICPGPVATEFAEVAEIPEERDVQALAIISSEQCAKESIWAMERGKALWIPGRIMRCVLGLQSLMPRWFMRWFMAAGAARLLASREND